jgi:hypothetical protein
MASGQSDFRPEAVPGTEPSDVMEATEPEDSADEDLSAEPVVGRDAEIRFDDDIQDAELGLNQSEIRGERKHGIAAVLGPANPWMSIGLEAYYTLDGLRSLSVSVGQGDWSISGRKGQIEYDVDARTKSTLVSFRYHLHESVPMFVTPMLGYGIWQGDLNPSGTDDPNSLSELELLKTAFNVRGMIVGASVGMSYHWTNGFFIEYALINFSQAIPIAADYTSESKSARQQVTQALTRPGSWGLLNLKLGYFF